MNEKLSIVVDTGSDLLPEEAEKLGVILLALTVRFDDEEFEDGVTISRDEFYHRMQGINQLPKTSLISPARYQSVFEQEIQKGNEVLCLTISSGVSGCYQSATMAAEDFEGKVTVVDTLHFCGSEYFQILRAIQLKNEGYGAKQIAEVLMKERNEVKIMAIFDTLEYLRLGGRISKAVSLVGNVLSIKPVLTITEGQVGMLAKARGVKNGYEKIKGLVEETGIDFSKPVILSYTGSNEERLNLFKSVNGSLFEGHEDEIIVSRVGATIGTYAGPDSVAITYYPKGL